MKIMKDMTKDIIKDANKDIAPKYVPTVGLEIHAELKTSSKMFCSCKNDHNEDKPNINVCPICMGHPGTLPVLNKQAVANVLKAMLADIP
jgi:aspartyl-tRNA(Asn)/glutamyl-tRNA(Gln) amidotransferase subunit B